MSIALGRLCTTATTTRSSAAPWRTVNTLNDRVGTGWIRQSSHSPLGAASSTRKKVTLPTIMSMYKKQEPITMLTAHDFPSAHVADQAGMDMVLVGDSLAMVALGMEDTSQILMDEMLLHCKSVARGSRAAFTVQAPQAASSIQPANKGVGRRSSTGVIRGLPVPSPRVCHQDDQGGQDAVDQARGRS